MKFNTVIALTIAVGFTALASYILQVRVDNSELDRKPTPLPVLATIYQMQQSYERESSYLGLVEAGKKTLLGFELPGLLAQVNTEEGSTVEAGDVIAQLDDAKLRARRKATAADLKRVNIELELARIKEKRHKNLSNTGAVSREAFDESRLIAQALMAQVESVQAQLDSIDIDLQKSHLRAPYSGIIADRYLDEGAVVNFGTPVVKLIQTGHKEAHIGISVEHIDSLTLGAQYVLSLRQQPVQATLQSVRPDVSPITRTAIAVFLLPQELSVLDGEAITLELAQAVHMEGGWLPVSALLEGQRGLWTVLRIANEEGRQLTIREAVEVLEIQGDMAYVRGTINDGDQVVAHGLHRITPGVAVTVVEQ